MAKRAVGTFAWRRAVLQNKLFWLVTVAMWAAFGTLVATGERSWILGLVGAAAFGPLVFLAAVWRAHFANTVGRFRAMATPEARFTLDDDNLTVAAEGTSSAMPWSAIKEVWERPDAWMVFLAPNQFFLLPLDGAPPDALGFFRAKTAQSPSGD